MIYRGLDDEDTRLPDMTAEEQDGCYHTDEDTSDDGATAYAKRAKPATDEQKVRIEEYRAMLQQSFDMSWGELADLQSLAAEGVIDPSDIEMLEAAGVSEWEATGYGEGDGTCGSCGAATDAAIAVDGEPFHALDADCRAVESFDANMRATWERANR